MNTDEEDFSPTTEQMSETSTPASTVETDSIAEERLVIEQECRSLKEAKQIETNERIDASLAAFEERKASYNNLKNLYIQLDSITTTEGAIPLRKNIDDIRTTLQQSQTSQAHSEEEYDAGAFTTRQEIFEVQKSISSILEEEPFKTLGDDQRSLGKRKELEEHYQILSKELYKLKTIYALAIYTIEQDSGMLQERKKNLTDELRLQPSQLISNRISTLEKQYETTQTEHSEITKLYLKAQAKFSSKLKFLEKTISSLVDPQPSKIPSDITEDTATETIPDDSPAITYVNVPATINDEVLYNAKPRLNKQKEYEKTKVLKTYVAADQIQLSSRYASYLAKNKKILSKLHKQLSQTLPEEKKNLIESAIDNLNKHNEQLVKIQLQVEMDYDRVADKNMNAISILQKKIQSSLDPDQDLTPTSGIQELRKAHNKLSSQIHELRDIYRLAVDAYLGDRRVLHQRLMTLKDQTTLISDEALLKHIEQRIQDITAKIAIFKSQHTATIEHYLEQRAKLLDGLDQIEKLLGSQPSIPIDSDKIYLSSVTPSNLSAAIRALNRTLNKQIKAAGSASNTRLKKMQELQNTGDALAIKMGRVPTVEKKHSIQEQIDQLERTYHALWLEDVQSKRFHEQIVHNLVQERDELIQKEWD
jgi:hypothetical protein